MHDAEHHQRPDQVELLLHRQRPRVQQRRRGRRLVEVVRVDQDEVPVAHVEQRGERVEAQRAVRPLRHDDRREERHEEQHQQQRRQQAAGPAGPERAELDRQGLAPLADEQRGDEEPRQDEEGVDAHEPAVHVRDAAVEHHHGDHGAGPHAVERREVGQTSVRDRALVVLHRAHPSRFGLGRHRTLGGRGPAILAEPGPRPPGGPRLATLSPPEPDPTAGPAPSAPPCPAAPTAVSPRSSWCSWCSAPGRGGRPRLRARPALSPLRARIVAIAQGQVGYRTDPSDTYCNKFSAYWNAGVDDCGNDNLDEEWCADFAAWAWKQAGAVWPTSWRPATSTATRPASTSGAPTTAPGTRSARATRPNRATSPSTASTPSAVTAVHVAVVVGGHRRRRRARRRQRRRRPHRLQRGRGRRPPGVRRREGQGRAALGLRLALVPDRRPRRDARSGRRRRAPRRRVLPRRLLGLVGRHGRARPPRTPWPRPARCGVRASSRQPAPRKAIGMMMQEGGAVVVVELGGDGRGDQRGRRRPEDDRGQVEGGEPGAAELGRCRVRQPGPQRRHPGRGGQEARAAARTKTSGEGHAG